MLTEAGYRHALDWLRGVQPGATANGSDLTLAGLIADELERLQKERDILHAFVSRCAGDGHGLVIHNTARTRHRDRVDRKEWCWCCLARAALDAAREVK